MTTTEQNKTIVSEFIQALFTRGDLDAVDEYLAEDFVNYDPPFGASADREGMRSAGALFRSVFPDWRSDLHLLVAEGDIVVEQFTATGTHTGAPDHAGGRHRARPLPWRASTSFACATGASSNVGAGSTTSVSAANPGLPV